MKTKIYYVVIIFVGLFNNGYLFPVGQSWDPNAPKNPFERSHIPFQSKQQDLPLSQQNSFHQSPRDQSPLFDPIYSDNAADWPTPPPIGGSPSQQESSSVNSNVNQNLQLQNEHHNSLPVPPNIPISNNPNPNTFNWVTPPPIPAIGSMQEHNKAFPSSPAEAHLWAKNKQAFNNGNPFDNLPIQSTVKPPFQIPANSNNPFDSLPIRNSISFNRHKRQNWPQTPADAHLAQQQGSLPNANPAQQNPLGFSPKVQNNPALPKPAQNPLMPPLHNPITPDASVSGFPNTNGAVVLGKDPRNLPDVGEQKIYLPNQLANQQDLIQRQNTPLKEGKPLLPSQLAQLQNNPAVPNSNSVQQNVPPPNPVPSNPGPPIQSQPSNIPKPSNPAIPNNNLIQPNPVPSNPGPPIQSQPSNIPKPSNPAIPNNNLIQPNPTPTNQIPDRPQLNKPMVSQQNPLGLSPALQNNPALPKPMSNPLMPPLHNPTQADPSVSGFPNTNGAVVLGNDPRNLPDVKEQKTFLPNQLANQQDLIQSQNTPIREPKPLLPSQIAQMQKFGTGKR